MKKPLRVEGLLFVLSPLRMVHSYALAVIAPRYRCRPLYFYGEGAPCEDEKCDENEY